MLDLTVKEARDKHFSDSGLPADGGYEDKWVPLEFWFLTFYLYNSESRKRAVKLHDIHHIVTGYKTDLRGEAEISAWELSAGIYDKHFARLINLAGLFYGAFLFPRVTFAAFVRGKYSQTLYSQDFTASLLDERVGALKKRLLPDVEPSPTWRHRIQYSALVGVACVPVFLLSLGLFHLLTR